MRPSFANHDATLIVSVVKGKTVNEVKGAIKNGSVNGAMAFDFHLSPLPKSEITTEKLKPLFDFTDKPVLALHYNQDYSLNTMNDSDDERAREFLIAVDAGAAGVDMQGYTFEPDRNTKASLTVGNPESDMSFVSACPNEVSLNPETIARQKEFISRVHDKGAEVLLSTHTGCFLDCTQVTDLLDFIHERKPDVIKLVTGECNTDEQLAEYLKTMIHIKNRYSDTKIHYHANGAMTKYTRMIGPLLGSYIMFCVDRFNESSVLDQLPLSTMVTVYNHLSRI